MFTPIVSANFRQTAHLLDSQRLGRVLLNATLALRFVVGAPTPDWCHEERNVRMLALWKDQAGKYHIPSISRYILDLNFVFFKRAGKNTKCYMDWRHILPSVPGTEQLWWPDTVHHSHLHRIISKDPNELGPQAKSLGLDVDDPIRAYYRPIIHHGYLACITLPKKKIITS